VQEGLQVLARFKRAQEEQVAIGQALGGAKGSALLRRAGVKAGVNAIVGDGDLVRRRAEAAHHIVRGLPADGDDRGGLAHAGPAQSAEVKPLGRRKESGQVQKAEVVHRHYARDRGRQGQDVDQAVDEVRVELAQQARQRELLPGDARRGPLEGQRGGADGNSAGAKGGRMRERGEPPGRIIRS